MKELKINLYKENVSLEIKDDGSLIATQEFCHDENLSENLLIEIDKLLKNSKLEIKEINEFSYETDQPDSYTSSRIVKAVTQTFNWAKKLKCQPPNCG